MTSDLEGNTSAGESIESPRSESIGASSEGPANSAGSSHAVVRDPDLSSMRAAIAKAVVKKRMNIKDRMLRLASLVSR